LAAVVRVFLLFIVVLECWPTSAAGQDRGLPKPERRRADGRIVYDLTFPDPRMLKSAPNYSYLIEAAQRPDVEIVSKEVQVLSAQAIAVAEPLYDVIYLGKTRDVPLYRITFHPYRVVPNGTEFTRKLTVHIKTSGTAIPIREPLAKETYAHLEEYALNVFETRHQLTMQKSLTSSRAVSSFAPPLPTQYIKMVLNEDGIYKITYADLTDSSGLKFAGVNPRTFRLWNRNREVPIYFQGESDGKFDRQDYFEFYGERNLARHNPYLNGIPAASGHYLDPWTDENVYILTWGESNGLRLIEESVGGARMTDPSYDRFDKKIHIEEDNVRLPIKNIILGRPAAEEDIWSFDNGLSIVQGGGTNFVNYSFELQGLDTRFSGDVFTLTLNLQGISTGRHEVSVIINQTSITSTPLSWNGATKLQFSLNIPSSVFRSGSNTLGLLTTSTPDRVLDEFALNWIEVTYKKRYDVTDDYIEFQKGSGGLSGVTYNYRITNFSDQNISLYKKGISRLVNWDLSQDFNTGRWSILMRDDTPVSETEYVAVTESNKRKPERIYLRNSANLQTGTHNARYLIITDNRLATAVQPIKAYRESTGYTCEIVRLEDIYDEFNGGMKSPYAIRDFLRFTYSSSNWTGTQGSPLYVLLVGDASFNPRATDDIVPIQYIQTQSYGPAASDHWYALVDDVDNLPDFFIGRLPVTTKEEIDIILAKIQKYESGIAGPWKNQIQFIGGQAETRGVLTGGIPRDIFRFQTNSLINQTLPQKFTPGRIFAYPRNDANIGGAADVIQAFSEGNLITAYLGHGGGGIWGDLDVITGLPLLNASQVSQAANTNGNFPLVMSMTCFVGAFDNTSVGNLGEVLLESADRGAIGVVASSGTGWIIGDFQLLQQSLNPLLTPGTTVGAALSQGKINYLTVKGVTDVETAQSGNSIGLNFIPQSMVHMFNYLGDPALKLPVPASGTVNISNLSPSSTQTITVSGTASFSTGTGVLEVFQTVPTLDSVPDGANIASLQTLLSVPFSISGNSYSVNVDLGTITGLKDGLAGVRAFGESSDGSNSFNASSDFAVNATFISDLTTVPTSPTSSDTIRIRARASDPQGIGSIVALIDVFGTVNAIGIPDTMSAGGNGVYLSQGVGPFGENDVVRYQIKVFDGNGDSTVSGKFEIRVKAGIDLTIGVPNSLDLRTDFISIGGTEDTRLVAVVQNKGFSSLNNVRVRFFQGDPRSGGILLGETTADVPGTVENSGRIGADTVSIVSTLPNGMHDVWTWIDPDSELTDINRNNNLGYSTLTLNVFNVTPAFGSTLAGSQNDTVFVDGGFRMNIPANTVNRPSAMRITKTHVLTTSQPDISPAIPLGATEPHAYDVRFLSTDEVSFGNKPVYLIFQYDTTRYPESAGYRDSLAMYTYDASNRRWRILGRDRSDIPGTVLVDITSAGDLGTLALMINRDALPPVVEPIVEGQFFTQNAIVPRRPKISAVISDQNGVDIRKNRMAVLLDNRPLAAHEIVIADSLVNSNVATLTLSLDQPEFTEGPHAISFQADDVNGNRSEPVAIFFRVATDFDIRVYGTFPNPFKTTTTFAFRIDAAEPLDDISISIYTVAGQRIRKISPSDVGNQVLNSIGYHEVVWDAFDDRGHPVANGIYFYKLRGKLNGKVIERKGKIAFFR
jgi:hypothetical protein